MVVNKFLFSNKFHIYTTSCQHFCFQYLNVIIGTHENAQVPNICTVRPPYTEKDLWSTIVIRLDRVSVKLRTISSLR